MMLPRNCDSKIRVGRVLAGEREHRVRVHQDLGGGKDLTEHERLWKELLEDACEIRFAVSLFEIAKGLGDVPLREV